MLLGLRHHEDETLKDNLLATAVVFGLVGFLYPIYSRLGQMQAWGQFTPADAQALTLALLCGVGAVGAALGINIGGLVANVTALFRKDV